MPGVYFQVSLLHHCIHLMLNMPRLKRDPYGTKFCGLVCKNSLKYPFETQLTLSLHNFSDVSLCPADPAADLPEL